jgi:uncharacterized protein
MNAFLTKMLTNLAIFLAVFSAVIVIAAPWLQRRLTYYPDTERVAPAEAGLASVEEIEITTPDGHRLIAWYTKAKAGQPTLLYFHGNAGSLVTRAERIKKYQALGRGMFMLSYRSFGGSSGTPSEKNNIADAKLAYDWLTSKLGVAPNDIILYGESLGSGVATQVAAEKQVAGLILDAPYTSLVDVGRLHYPWLPVDLLAVDRYQTLDFIPKIRAPLFIVHGEQDAVIPVEMGRAVLKAATGPKDMATFPQAGHADHGSFGSFEAINGWIDRLRSQQQLQSKG